LLDHPARRESGVIGLDARIRPLRPDDVARLVRMFDRLSPETVTRRFFTLMPKLSDPMLRMLMAIDHDTHEAVVVQVGDEIIALASYHRRQGDPSVADVAILVEDGWQHHGLGRRLMRSLGRLASSRGVTLFHADVLADNRPAIGLIQRMARQPRGTWSGDGLAYDLPLVAA
jgi:GNAT superfamily N-acetyltransferase